LYIYVTIRLQIHTKVSSMKNGRRKFLKKMAYSAPVVASLGMLVEPNAAKADGRTDPKNEKSRVTRRKSIYN